MPFIPHTKQDIAEMLAALNIKTTEELFDEIPEKLKIEKLTNIPPALSEMEVSKLMENRAAQDGGNLCFIGAGAYEHYIPSVVWDIVSRGEFMTAYTPYQAEASQGTLQLLYEYQTMMASLTGMDVSNASLYDGATSVAEALLMAIRANRKVKAKRVLIPETLHPHYREAIKTTVTKQAIEVVEVPFDTVLGHVTLDNLNDYAKDEFAAFVIPQPNFFGVLETVDELVDWAHQHNALAIGVVNPLSLALLKAPGSWGSEGADIVCGEAQPLGIPLSTGGPYLGILCCKEAYVRQMPGRIVGKTTDTDGKTGYTLTLQAREQHIRRNKATSNICSNEGLMAAAATIYMALLGPNGLKQVASVCHHKMRKLVEKVSAINGAEVLFDQPYFNEVVLQLPKSADEVVEKMLGCNIDAGLALGKYYPDMKNCLLVCCTETKTDQDIEKFAKCLDKALAD